MWDPLGFSNVVIVNSVLAMVDRRPFEGYLFTTEATCWNFPLWFFIFTAFMPFSSFWVQWLSACIVCVTLPFDWFFTVFALCHPYFVTSFAIG
jgi:hypothetical protein